MPEFTVHTDARLEVQVNGGLVTLVLADGDTVELDQDVADAVGRDLPGALKPKAKPKNKPKDPTKTKATVDDRVSEEPITAADHKATKRESDG